MTLHRFFGWFGAAVLTVFVVALGGLSLLRAAPGAQGLAPNTIPVAQTAPVMEQVPALPVQQADAEPAAPLPPRRPALRQATLPVPPIPPAVAAPPRGVAAVRPTLPRPPIRLAAQEHPRRPLPADRGPRPYGDPYADPSAMPAPAPMVPYYGYPRAYPPVYARWGYSPYY